MATKAIKKYNVAVTYQNGKIGNTRYYTTKSGNTYVRAAHNSVQNDPHSDAQMHQRLQWASRCVLWNLMKGNLKDGFNNKANNHSDFNAYMQINQGVGAFFTKKEMQNGAQVMLPVTITDGKLDTIEYEFSGTGVDKALVTNISLGSLTLSASTSIKDFSDAVVSGNDDFEYGDELCMVSAVQVSRGGIPRVKTSFHKVTLSKTDERLLYSVTGAFGFANSGHFLAATGIMEGDCVCYLHSRRDAKSGKLICSTQAFACNNSVVYDFYTSDTQFALATESYGEDETSYLDPDKEDEEAEPAELFTQTVSVGSGMESMGSVSGGGSFAEGTEITIHAVANSGYTFKGWKLNGGSTYESTEADYTFEVEADNSFVAEFEAEAQQVTLSVGQDTNPNWGDIQINDRTAAKSDTLSVASGTEVTIKAIAATGYSFSSWSDGNTSATRTITVTENKTINASFESR